MEVSLQTFDSKDGTLIAFERSGHGPPLVLVHGMTADHTRWKPVLPMLEMYFTVYAMDRRGRGRSADAPGYEIDREVEDVTALVDSIGKPAALLGHAYGAILALEATMHTPNVSKLVLYEPPILTAASTDEAIFHRMEELLAAGDREAVVTAFFRQIVRSTDDEVRMLRSLPGWSARVAAAHTILRELRSSDGYRFKASRFAGFQTPTLLLIGGESPPHFREAVKAVHAAIPTAHVSVLPGQRQAAMNSAPHLFLRPVVDFLQRA